jgi:hypothetical protein
MRTVQVTILCPYMLAAGYIVLKRIKQSNADKKSNRQVKPHVLLGW